MSEVLIQDVPGAKRIGNTGVWTYVLTTPENTILATSAWGTNYEFNPSCWFALTPAP